MAFLNEQGVQTLWTKIKTHTAAKIAEAAEDVRAEIPDKLANPEALNFKDKDNKLVKTYDGSNEINVKAGNNIVISENTSGDVVISATLTGVTVENAQHAATADEATKAKQDGNGKVIADTYATKEALGNANTKIDNVINGTTTVGKATLADTATTASKVSKSLTIKVGDGTTDGTTTTTFDGSVEKTVNITPAAIGAQPVGEYATKTELNNHVNNKQNPHAVTKAQVGLSEVENKSSATIRGELTSEDVVEALGFTPQQAGNYQPVGEYATQKELDDLTTIVGNKLEQSDLANYATETYADTAEADAISAAKTYTDEAIAKIYEVDNTDTITSILELSAAIKDNDDAIDSLNQIAGTKLPNTTAITAGTGISVTNSGVLANGVEISNTGIVTLAVGTGNNGTTKVNGTNTTLVKGLNTAAYKADTYFATATGLNDLIARVTPIESGYVKEFEFKMANATKTDGTEVASASVANNKATITLYAIPDSFIETLD